MLMLSLLDQPEFLSDEENWSMDQFYIGNV